MASSIDEDEVEKLLDTAQRLGRCPECRYPLVGLRAAGQCPECGWEYDESTHIWWPPKPWQKWLLAFSGMWLIGWCWLPHLLIPLGQNLLAASAVVIGIMLGATLVVAAVGWILWRIYGVKKFFSLRLEADEEGILQSQPIVVGAAGGTLKNRYLIPWKQIRRVRVTGRYHAFGASVLLDNGFEIPFNGFYRDRKDLERFVEVVRERSRAARAAEDHGDTGCSAGRFARMK